MPVETSRTVSSLKIKDPDDPNTFVVLKIIDQIGFVKERGFQEYVYGFQNWRNEGTRTSRTVEVGESKLKVSRINTLQTIDENRLYQESVFTFNNSDPPTHLKTHDVKIYATDAQGNKNEDVWIKVRRIDQIGVMDPKEGYQETVFSLNWSSNPDWDYTNRGRLYDQTPPYRLDPFQTIIDCSFASGKMLFVVYEGGNVAAIPMERLAARNFKPSYTKTLEQFIYSGKAAQTPIGGGEVATLSTVYFDGETLVSGGNNFLFAASKPSGAIDAGFEGDPLMANDGGTVYVPSGSFSFSTQSKTFTQQGTSPFADFAPISINGEGRYIYEVSAPYMETGSSPEAFDALIEPIEDYLGLMFYTYADAAGTPQIVYDGESPETPVGSTSLDAPFVAQSIDGTFSDVTKHSEESWESDPDFYANGGAGVYYLLVSLELGPNNGAIVFSPLGRYNYPNDPNQPFDGEQGGVAVYDRYNPDVVNPPAITSKTISGFGVTRTATGSWGLEDIGLPIVVGLLSIADNINGGAEEYYAVLANDELGYAGYEGWMYDEDFWGPTYSVTFTEIDRFQGTTFSNTSTNGGGYTEENSVAITIYSFPLGYNEEIYYSSFGASQQTIYTPYGAINGSYLDGKWQLCNGEHLIQGFSVNGSDYKIYLDGDEISSALATALGTSANSIDLMLMDIPSADIKRLK